MTSTVIEQLRDLGWGYSRIAGHYRVSEREVRRWSEAGVPERLPAPPHQLHWATALIVNDTQFPYYDPALWDVTCQIARDAEVEHLIWDGDVLDFPQLSRFSHNPYVLQTVRKDIEDFHCQLRTPLIDAIGSTLTQEDWNDGNHEWRYERYYSANAPALEGVLPPPREMLQLPVQVRYHPYERAKGTMLTPRLLVSHGWRAQSHSAYTAKNSADEVGGLSLVIGHTHRVGVFMRKTPTGVQRAYEVGHMADERFVPKAVPGDNNWQQCAGTIVRYRRDGSAFKVELNEVLEDGWIVTNGREYRK